MVHRQFWSFSAYIYGKGLNLYQIVPHFVHDENKSFETLVRLTVGRGEYDCDQHILLFQLFFPILLAKHFFLLESVTF